MGFVPLNPSSAGWRRCVPQRTLDALPLSAQSAGDFGDGVSVIQCFDGINGNIGNISLIVNTLLCLEGLFPKKRLWRMVGKAPDSIITYQKRRNSLGAGYAMSGNS